ncbi:caspase family protein [Dactylosporangium sp. AC04546]|uniref:caspase, EACC1-associated type n=1 Tax=Dactylosporangium sp. AC04546 TaxID=2862460 RepID=UPI001EE08E4C|nr:caspase family protein [Dactylosporangium sp. AC04546]WVK79929.1 caspase family protein [Dactylosporangium sp. AC04546]
MATAWRDAPDRPARLPREHGLDPGRVADVGPTWPSYSPTPGAGRPWIAPTEPGRCFNVRVTLPDPHRSRAVLVGSGAYTELEPLPAVPANLRALQGLLTDPRVWGLPPEHCRVVEDPASTDAIRDALHDACRDASDALVFYYAGHGVVEADGLDLYLTTPRTSLEPIHAAVRYDDVRRLIASARCASKVVLLDCCYSGLALAGAMGDATQIVDRVSIDASYVMTATAETRLALAPPGERFTAFTGELVDVLRNGLPNAAELLEMGGIYWQLVRSLTDKQRPTPQARARNLGHAIAFARNLGRVADGAVPPAAAEAPVQAPPGPPLPSGEDLRMTPARLLETAARLPAPLADGLLAANAAHRPVQEVAATLALMQPAGGRPGYRAGVEAVLAAAARRAPAEVAELVADLAELGVEGFAGRLVALGGGNDATSVVALATLLHDPAQAGLLDAAARARAGRPAELIAFIAALQTSDLAPAVDGFVTGLAGVMPAADVLALADALRDAGHDDAAFRLYSAAADALVERPAPAVAGIAAAMLHAGRSGAARALLDRLAERASNAERAQPVLLALWAEGLTAEAARLLTQCAERLTEDDLLALADELRFAGRPADGLRLLQEAGTSGERLIRFAAHLHAAGRPIDGNRLLDGRFDTLPGPDLAPVVLAVARDANETAARRLLDRASGLDSRRLAGLLHGLGRAGEHHELLAHLDRIVVDQVTLAGAAPALIHLLRLGDRAGVERLLRRARAGWFADPDAAPRAFATGGAERAGVAAVNAQVLIVFAVVAVEPLPERLLAAFLEGDGQRIDMLARQLLMAGPVVAGEFLDRLDPPTAAGLAAPLIRSAPLLRSAGLLRAYEIIERRWPGDPLTDFAAAVARRARASGVAALLAYLDGQPDGERVARMIARHALAAGDGSYRLPHEVPDSARLVQAAAWAVRSAPDLLDLVPWLVGRPASAAGVAVQAGLARWPNTGAPVEWTPGFADTVRARLRIPPDTLVLRAWALDDRGVLAFTDRAIRHAWLDEPVGELPYLAIAGGTFESPDGTSLYAELADGRALTWRLGTSAPTVRIDLAELLQGVAALIAAGEPDQSSVDGRTTSISKA